LPLFDWDSEGIDKYLQALEGKNIMVTRWSHLDSLNEKRFAEISSEYTLNYWNQYSIQALKSHQVKKITGSPELSVRENIQLAKNSDIKLEIIFAGKIPLIYSRHCFQEVLKCSGNCRTPKLFIDLDKGLEYELHCMDSHRELVSKNPFLGNVSEEWAADGLDITFRYNARYDDVSQIKQTVKAITHNDNYYNSLNNYRMWKGNYSNNWLESVK